MTMMMMMMMMNRSCKILISSKQWPVARLVTFTYFGKHSTDRMPRPLCIFISMK